MMRQLSLEVFNDRVLAAVRLPPLLKWPGGKTGELNVILPRLPCEVHRYFEPFVGGGAVFFAISARIPAFINDKSAELIRLYRHVAEGDEAFFEGLTWLSGAWEELGGIVIDRQEELTAAYERCRQMASGSQVAAELLEFVADNRGRFEGLLCDGWGYDGERFVSEVDRNIVNKCRRMRRMEEKRGPLDVADVVDNFESALKSSFYMYMRYLHNCVEVHEISASRRSVIFLFIRECAYGAMFRFNKQGKFNVPYGGISYNSKDFAKKMEALRDPALRSRLATAEIENCDFLTFLRREEPKPEDFIFLDPPYDTEFSEYDQNAFSKDDHGRLADYLLNECKARFMLVIQCTPYILSLYEGRGLHIERFGKVYSWNVKDRNDRKAFHLVISNYVSGRGSLGQLSAD